MFPEPKASGLYYLVRVFRSLTAARVYTLRAKRIGSMTRRGLAMCSSYDVIDIYKATGRRRMRPICGEIILTARGLTMRVITHEVTHAAIGWFRRRRLEIDGMEAHARRRGRWASVNEERCCDGLSTMARQIVVGAQRRGLLPA